MRRSRPPGPGSESVSESVGSVRSANSVPAGSGEAGRGPHPVAAWFALDSDWQRPEPTAAQRRADVRLMLLFMALAVLTIECLRSLGVLADAAPTGVVYALTLAGMVPLAWRRRFPLTVLVLTQAHFFAMGLVVPEIMQQLVVQVLCFFGFYSGVAWGRGRRRTFAVAALAIAFMMGWVTWQIVLGPMIAQLTSMTGGGSPGLLPPALAAVIFTYALNLVFFVGAFVWGQSSWLAARDRARADAAAATIADQAHRLREQAVVDERLRIARELHDVVAHHVSVMGVQAGAARRALAKKPEAAAGALLAIEGSSREAVGEMRALLRTLRPSGDADGAGPVEPGRDPGPDLGRLEHLVEQVNAGDGLRVTLDVVEEPAGARGAVPGPVSLSAYRIVQEGISNVRAHSAARAARVTLRVVAGAFAEVEVVDGGPARPGTSGTGLGLLGMRERVASHGGTLEVGPRAAGGYRVRARFPLTPKETP